jgi:carbamoyl-phosphate synthase large subunit
MNILITGAGGDISQSLCKALRNEGIAKKIVGTDLYLDHVGQFIFDSMYKLPKCDDEEYFSRIEQIVAKENIAFIIPGSEPELKQFQHNEFFESRIDVTIIKANNYSLEVGFDKLLTTEFLIANNLPYPKTYLVENVNSLDQKMVLKPRQGSGSKDLYITADNDVLKYVKRKHFDFIVQEYIDAPEDEYTCGLYRSSQGILRSIIIKRKLMPGGVTGVGEIIVDAEIDNVLKRIGVGLDLIGSINVQLRMRHGEPVVFEINPRFSSTVFFRHQLGFKDLIWSLKDSYCKTIDTYYPPKSGTKFYRGYKEYFKFFD